MSDDERPGEDPGVNVVGTTLLTVMQDLRRRQVPHEAVGDRFAWEREVRAAPDVVGVRLLVLLTLATYMDRHGRRAHPGQRTIARDTGLSEKTVQRHLAAAWREGWVEKVGSGGMRGDGTPIAVTYSASAPLAAGGRTGESAPTSGGSSPSAPPRRRQCAPQTRAVRPPLQGAYHVLSRKNKLRARPRGAAPRALEADAPTAGQLATLRMAP